MSYYFETTVFESEMPVRVEFDYEAGEKEVLHPVDKAHPGSEDKIIVNSVLSDNGEYLDALDDADLEIIETECQEHLDEFYREDL